MIGLTNATALTASGFASFAAAELRFHGFHDDEDGIREAAGEAVVPLLRAAVIALELSGLLTQDHSAGVHDVILDYITAPAANSNLAEIRQ